MVNIITIPTSRNGKRTFSAIVEAAKILFNEQGYHATSISDITSKAEIAIGTFYLYFPTKLSLYEYLLRVLQEDIRNHLNEAIRMKKTRYDKEREGLKAFILYVKKHPWIYNIIWESLYIDKKLFINYYNEFARRYDQSLQLSLQKEEIHPVDTQVLGFIFMGISNFIGLKVLLDLGTNNDNVELLVDRVMTTLSSGIFR